MTPTDSDDVQEVTPSYGEISSSVPAAPQITEDQPLPGRNPPLYPIALVKGQSPLVLPHGMGFHAAPTSGEASWPPPTPPDEAPPFGGMHPSPNVSRQDSKYTNPSPRAEGSEGKGRGSLDLSNSSRSSGNTFLQQTPHLPSSPAVSSSTFTHFGLFPGLARFHEMNPIFRERFEDVQKSPYNSSLYAANLPPHLLPLLISSQLQNLVQHQQVRIFRKVLKKDKKFSLKFK